MQVLKKKNSRNRELQIDEPVITVLLYLSQFKNLISLKIKL